VHGESVKGMTQSQLLEMRKKFGILFQDGALFGSVGVGDLPLIGRRPCR
jgi:phospholipid/cholesterol/gamma-HCH transport system ATP-binding protein